MSVLPTANVRVPLRLRVVGEPTEELWAQLEEALALQYSRALRTATAALASGELLPRAPVREPYDPSRSTPEGYLIPSYDGTPTAVRERGELSAQRDVVFEPPTFTPDELVEWIRRSFPETDGLPQGNTFFGAHAIVTTYPGKPYLFYISGMEGERFRFVSLYLYVRIGQGRGALALQPGLYTLVFRPDAPGRLTRLGDEGPQMLENPDKLDITVKFVVGDPRGVRTREPPSHRFFPVVRVTTQSKEAILATDSEIPYFAAVNLLEFDESGSLREVDLLRTVTNFMNSSFTYRWKIDKIEKLEGGGEARKEIFTREDSSPSLRMAWKEPGLYDVGVTVQVRGEYVAPWTVSASRREQVIPLKAKLITSLAALENLEWETGKPIWSETWGSDVLRGLERQLASEQDPARRRMLTDAIEQLKKQLEFVSGYQGPFALHAIFMDRETSQIIPLKLFVVDAGSTQSTLSGERLNTWYILDLTAPAFYRRYEGQDPDDTTALLKALDSVGTHFRSKYPPGHILVNLEWPYMEQLGIQPERLPSPLLIETESTEKTAYSVVTGALAVAGVVGLGAAFAIPGANLVVAYTLVVVGVVGAALAVENIVDRVQQGRFAWDVETFTDLVSIAGAIAAVGATAAAARAGSVLRASGTVAPLSVEAAGTIALAAEASGTVPELARILRTYKIFLYASLATNVSSGVLMTASTIDALERLNLIYDQELKAKYIAAFGKAEGERRWLRERENYVFSILARAAVSGTLIVVASRQQVQQVRAIRAVKAEVAALRETLPTQEEIEEAFSRWAAAPPGQPLGPGPPRGAGPGVNVRARVTGQPHTVLEVGSGPTRTYVGFPEESFVRVVRTDINESFPIDRVLDATGQIPPEFVEAFDTVLINNPRGYVPNLTELGKALTPGGKIIVQGNERANPDFAAAIKTARTPPGFTRTVEFSPRRDLPPEYETWDPAAIRANILGEGFVRTSGEAEVRPNFRVSFTKPLTTGPNRAPGLAPPVSGAVPSGDSLRFLQLVHPGQRVAAFERYSTELSKLAHGPSTSARRDLPDGGALFLGRQGEAVVIDGRGRVFRGNVADREQFTPEGGGFRPNYAKLKEVVK
jgi:hypothetical protein